MDRKIVECIISEETFSHYYNKFGGAIGTARMMDARPFRKGYAVKLSRAVLGRRLKYSASHEWRSCYQIGVTNTLEDGFTVMLRVI